MMSVAGRRFRWGVHASTAAERHAWVTASVTNPAHLTPMLGCSVTSIVVFRSRERGMRGFQNSSFDPQTLIVLETAFDEAWLTLKAAGNTTVRPDELARSVLRLAMEGERDPMRLHDGALRSLLPATSWREAG